jgi:hypothetical protein
MGEGPSRIVIRFGVAQKESPAFGRGFSDTDASLRSLSIGGQRKAGLNCRCDRRRR